MCFINKSAFLLTPERQMKSVAPIDIDFMWLYKKNNLTVFMVSANGEMF